MLFPWITLGLLANICLIIFSVIKTESYPNFGLQPNHKLRKESRKVCHCCLTVCFLVIFILEKKKKNAESYMVPVAVVAIDGSRVVCSMICRPLINKTSPSSWPNVVRWLVQSNIWSDKTLLEVKLYLRLILLIPKHWKFQCVYSNFI